MWRYLYHIDQEINDRGALLHACGDTSQNLVFQVQVLQLFSTLVEFRQHSVAFFFMLAHDEQYFKKGEEMKFTINKNILNNALNIISTVSNNKTPVASKFLIIVNNETLEFKASNSEQSITHTIQSNEDKFKCIDSGEALIPTELFFNCVKASLYDDLLIMTEGSLLIIKSGKGKSSLHLSNSKDFPNIDFPLSINDMEITQSELCKFIDQSVFATSTNIAGRPILTGVNFASENRNLRVCSTDSYRLSKIDTEFPLKEGTSVTIPKEALSIVKKLCGKTEENIKISFTERAVYFKLPNTTLKSALLAGGYPEVTRLIPTDFSYELTCNRTELIGLLKAGMFIKADNGLPVFKLICSETEARLSNKNLEIGEFNMPLEAFTYKGEPFTIHFDGNYMYEALKVYSSETVKINLVSDMRPFTITAPEEPHILELMLPVRTYD